MCGITGTYNFKRSQLQKRYTALCLQTMAHRGPDAQCIWDNAENYITGFVRLAIRDTSNNGNQPMLSEDENYCISFNGEIYNTAVLAYKLKPYRSSFKSSSDTEILLYSLIHLGVEETLQTADGMFAFAFFSCKQNVLVLARDRVGIKPLYIGKSLDGIVYSSQYDHIINHPFLKNEAFDASAIATYLLLGYVPENTGVISNTFLLPHGTYAKIQDQDFAIHTYYTYSIDKTNEEKSIGNIIEKSVEQQLVSDVPVGTFMSGGVDSTLVSYHANIYAPIQAFTIGLQDTHLDEVAAAKTYAEAFRLEHAYQYVSADDVISLVNANAKAFTEPFADFSSLPTLLLSQFAKKKVTVALSGDGGDELFWGYPRNRKALSYLQFYKKNNLHRKASILYSKIKKPASTEIKKHWNQDSFVDHYYSTLFIGGAAHWVPKIYSAALPLLPYFFEESKALYSSDSSDIDRMNVMRKMEIDIHLQRILLKVDRSSMYHSLEVRVPMLSNDMLEFSRSFTYQDCIRADQGKMPLKNLLSSKASNQLAFHPKKGFVVPIDTWIRNELKHDVTAKLLNMPAALSHAFDTKELSKMLASHMNGKADFGWLIWAVYSLVNWYDTHVTKFPAITVAPVLSTHVL